MAAQKEYPCDFLVRIMGKTPYDQRCANKTLYDAKGYFSIPRMESDGAFFEAKEPFGNAVFTFGSKGKKGEPSFSYQLSFERTNDPTCAAEGYILARINRIKPYPSELLTEGKDFKPSSSLVWLAIRFLEDVFTRASGGTAPLLATKMLNFEQGVASAQKDMGPKTKKDKLQDRYGARDPDSVSSAVILRNLFPEALSGDDGGYAAGPVYDVRAPFNSSSPPATPSRTRRVPMDLVRERLEQRAQEAAALSPAAP